MERKSQRDRRHIKWWVAGGISLILLSVSAFVAGSLIENTTDDVESSTTTRRSAEGQFTTSINLDVQPASELPDTSPDVTGVLIKNQDDVLFIGTGNARISMDAEDQMTPIYDGPEIEVVTTEDTSIYEDRTFLLADEDLLQAGGSFQQILEQVGSTENIDLYTFVQVWGRRSGDRIVATVLVYRAL